MRFVGKGPLPRAVVRIQVPHAQQRQHRQQEHTHQRSRRHDRVLPLDARQFGQIACKTCLFKDTQTVSHEPIAFASVTALYLAAVRGSQWPTGLVRGYSFEPQWTYLVSKIRYGQVHEKPWHREERRRPEQCEHERKRSPHA